MHKIVKAIDTVSEWTGKTGQWAALILVLVITYGVILRYGFRAPALWPYEVSIMLGATLYVFAFGYALRDQAHVRVDVIYAHLPRKIKAIIDILGDLLAFFPLIILMIYRSYFWTAKAYVDNERLGMTGWSPPALPLRLVITLGLCVLALQGIAQLIRDLSSLRSNVND